MHRTKQKEAENNVKNITFVDDNTPPFYVDSNNHSGFHQNMGRDMGYYVLYNT